MPGPLRELSRFLRASLLDPVSSVPDPPESSRRRHVVVAVTIVVGAVTLGWALSVTPGDPLFYAATASVAGVWVVGSFASGPLPLGRAHTRAGGSSSSVLQSVILGGVLLLLFLGGALVVGRVPVLRGPVDTLLAHAYYGYWPVVAALTALNGIAEELFFRGALFAALPRHRVAASTLLYALATVLSGVPLLVLAAGALGWLVGAQRRVTGGVLGPIVTHLTWSLGMLFLLPSALNLWS